MITDWLDPVSYKLGQAAGGGGGGAGLFETVLQSLGYDQMETLQMPSASFDPTDYSLRAFDNVGSGIFISGDLVFTHRRTGGQYSAHFLYYTDLGKQNGPTEIEFNFPAESTWQTAYFAADLTSIMTNEIYGQYSFVSGRLAFFFRVQ